MTRKNTATRSWCALGAAIATSALLMQAMESGAAPPLNTPTLAERANAALGLTESRVFAMEVAEAPGDALVSVVPIDGIPQILHMQPHSVRAESYRVFGQHPDGSLFEVKPTPVNTFRGTVIGVDGSAVAASWQDDGLHARVLYPDGSDFWIEPLAAREIGAAANDYVVYPNSALQIPGLTCATDLDTHVVELPDANAPQPVGGGNCLAQLACDADFEFFSARGSISSVTNWINGVVNAVNIQYERDVQISHTVTAIVVRSSSNDPYNNTKNASSLLNQVRSEWESNNPGGAAYDLAQLFTGRDLAGTTIGVAWVGSVCTSFRYSLVQSLFNGNDPVPDGCATDLSAHELGHNWGADHCSCSAFTMNSFITCANVFHPTSSIPEILAHRNSRTCLDNCGGGPATGACCLTDGSCAIETAADCTSQGGTYQGDGAGCSPDPCGGGDPTGACCVGTSCSIETAAECTSAGGTYQGDGSDCSGSPCGGGGGDVVVECITYVTRGGPQQNKHLDVTVTVLDGGAPVGGANVSMTLSRTTGGSWNFGGSTDADGTVTFTLLSAGDGCYSSDVTSITGAGSFDGTEPFNGFQKGSDSFPDEDCRTGSDGCGSG